jgi:Zn-finger nucleic acid-binding protein
LPFFQARSTSIGPFSCAAPASPRRMQTRYDAPMPRCPKCRTRADLIKYEGIPVHSCGSCGGHWVRAPRLSAILARRELQMPEPVKRKMIELAEASHTRERVYCQTCGKRMERESFKYWSDIQLDRCPNCKSIWLDRGELEKCQIYWEYLQDHPDSEDAQRITKLAHLDARADTRKRRLKAKLENMRAHAMRRDAGSALLWMLFTLDDDLDPGADSR